MLSIKKLILIIGVLLILLSIYPLILTVREQIIAKNQISGHKIEKVTNLNNMDIGDKYLLEKPFFINNTKVEIVTENTGRKAPETMTRHYEKDIMFIHVRINGKEVLPPVEAWISPSKENDSKFLTLIDIFKLKNKRTGEESFAIVQRLSKDMKKGETIDDFLNNQKWRALYVKKDKTIVKEEFSYTSRSPKFALSIWLIQLGSLSSTYMGYESEIFTFIPAAYYPFVYPFVSFVIGVIIVILLSIIIWRDGNKKSKREETQQSSRMT